MSLTRAHIRQEWDWIGPALAKVKEERGGTWRPEDVYAACVSGEADLYVDADMPGFIVLKPMMDDFAVEKFLLVWMAYGDVGEALDRYFDEVMGIARQFGFRRVQMWRRPKGAVTCGRWTKTYTIYEVSL